MQLQIPPELAKSLSRRCKGRDGARQMRRLVKSEVEGGLAAYLLRCSRKPPRIRMKLENGELRFQG